MTESAITTHRTSKPEPGVLSSFKRFYARKFSKLRAEQKTLDGKMDPESRLRQFDLRTELRELNNQYDEARERWDF